MDIDAADYYVEQAAFWSIHLKAPDADASASLYNQMADEATQAFWGAFRDLCSLERAEGDIVEIGEDGRIGAVWAEVLLEHRADDGRFRPSTTADVPDIGDRRVLSRVVVTCGARLQLPNGRVRELPDSLHFQYDSDLPSAIGEPAIPRSPTAIVAVEVDPWLDAPWNLRGRVDNRDVAALNRPRLEQALRKWESAVGSSISEVSSVPYPDLVDRYGFRPGIQSPK